MARTTAISMARYIATMTVIILANDTVIKTIVASSGGTEAIVIESKW